MRKIWTAVVEFESYRNALFELSAQDKSSLSNLIRRIKADDPIWHRSSVRYEKRKMYKSTMFNRGLAYECKELTAIISRDK